MFSSGGLLPAKLLKKRRLAKQHLGISGLRRTPKSVPWAPIALARARRACKKCSDWSATAFGSMRLASQPPHSEPIVRRSFCLGVLHCKESGHLLFRNTLWKLEGNLATTCGNLLRNFSQAQDIRIICQSSKCQTDLTQGRLAHYAQEMTCACCASLWQVNVGITTQSLSLNLVLHAPMVQRGSISCGPCPRRTEVLANVAIEPVGLHERVRCRSLSRSLPTSSRGNLRSLLHDKLTLPRHKLYSLPQEYDPGTPAKTGAPDKISYRTRPGTRFANR